MLSKVKKIIALVLVLAMVVALVGCSNNDDEMSSGGVVYVDNEVLVDENGNPITDKDAQQGGDAQQGDAQQGGSTQSGGTTQQGGTTANGVNPEDYRGTKVVFATTILSKTDESGPVVDAFEKKYGITVEEILVGDNVNEIAGKLAAGTNIDVMRTCSDFPAAMAVLQPITAAKLDMTDPIWNQSIFKYTTFGGEPYCCDTTNNVWTENACVVYSKSLLKRANAYEPYQYDAQGKWTWDAYAAIAKAVDSIDGLGTGIRGTYIDDGYLLASAGFQLYKFENGKFVNGLKDPEHAVAYAKIASWNKEGFVTNSVVDAFAKGNTGIACGLGWSLKKTGSNANYPNWSDIGFYYLPAYKEGMKPGGTSMFKAWGICRGADNPVGAGLFLRYYLDAGNYDTQGAFISPEAEKFFFQMTESISMDSFYPQFTSGDSTQGITGFFEWDWEGLYLNDPTQMAVKLNTMSDSVDKAVDTLNKFVSKNTGIRE
ncbi:MAG: hypothetical protein IJN56_04725 [Clostridia bacterium]|nr:hypothetical protein [Clostridia bacterium]